MELCDEDLRVIIQRCAESKKLLSKYTILDWVIQISLGLNYIHGEGCIHRDLKPENSEFCSTERLETYEFQF